MSQGNTTGNIAIGLAVVVLGFIVYKSIAGSAAVTYTGTAPTAKQTATAATPASVAAAVASASSALGSLFGTTSSSAGSLNTYLAGVGTDLNGGLDQAYTSTSYNPDQISSDIASDTNAAMASGGESGINLFGFSV
jgi:hypothetical protein